MKKSEKIELRVDYEEKQRLKELAKSQGLSTSEAVRELLKSVPAESTKWPTVLALSALGVALVALCLPLINSSGAVYRNDQSPNMTSFGLDGHDFIFNTEVPHVDGFEASYDIRMNNWEYEARNYKLKQKVVAVGEGVFELNVAICRPVGDTCEQVDTAKLILSPPAIPPRIGRALLYDKNFAPVSSNGDDNPFLSISTLGPGKVAEEKGLQTE